VLSGTSAGLTATGGRLFTQDSPGVPGSAELGDGFGYSLAADDPGTTAAASASPSGPSSRVQRGPPGR
jgi:hypothetical protein